MKRVYKDLKELKDADIDHSKLEITLDNDQTTYYFGNVELTVKSAGNGYNDYAELYELYFPESNVEFC